MTEEEAFELYMDKDEPVARAMFAFRTECARIEQAEAQRRPPSRRAVILMHHEAVVKILAAVGHTLPNDPLHMHEGKWWFWDETWSHRCGEYQTRAGAKKALDIYCREVLGQP